MEQVPKSVPSYWTRRRKIKSDVAAFFENSRHSVDSNVTHNCSDELNSCLNMTDDYLNIHDNNILTGGISDSDDTYCSLLSTLPTMQRLAVPTSAHSPSKQG